MPTEIKELIMEFAGEKQQIKNYFLNNIANFIDPSLIYVDNKCQFCYIIMLKFTNWNYLCESCHYGSNIGITKKKWFSVTSLITIRLYKLGKLYYAIDDIHRFLFLMSITNYYSFHPLACLHSDLLRTVELIE